MLDSSYKDNVLNKDIPGLELMLESLNQEKHPEEFGYITERIKDLKIDRALGSNLSGNNLSSSNKNADQSSTESEYTDQSLSYKVKLAAKETKDSDPIKGTFAKRIFASGLDYTLLGVLGLILGIFFSKFFVGLGEYGIFIGFTITMLYLGIGNSHFGNGTLGKKIFGLVVVDSDYELLSLKKSMQRAFIVTSPYFISILALPMFSIPQTVDNILTTLCSAIILSYPIIYILNTRTRQTIADLLIKTYVVNVNKPARELLLSPRKSWIISISAAVLLSMFPLLISQFNPFIKVSSIKNSWQEINNIDGVIEAGINLTVFKFNNSGNSKDRLKNIANLYIKTSDDLVSNNTPKNIQEIEIVQKAVRIFLQSYDNINEVDLINVTLSYGYTIGIYSNTNSITQSGTVHEWYTKVNKNSF